MCYSGGKTWDLGVSTSLVSPWTYEVKVGGWRFVNSHCQLIKSDDHVVEDTAEAEECTWETDIHVLPLPLHRRILARLHKLRKYCHLKLLVWLQLIIHLHLFKCKVQVGPIMEFVPTILVTLSIIDNLWIYPALFHFYSIGQ